MTTQTKYRKYDSESDYYAMGYRIYSAEFGRFLAVDPLFEAMPRHNPYHYSFNSPMFWSDPSGLAPVKEKVKGGEKLLALEWNREIFREQYDNAIAENGRLQSLIPKNGREWKAWFESRIADGYGAGSGSRIGIVGAGYNGAYQTMELNVPANWDTKSLDKSTEPANKHLRELQKTTDNEVGYLLRYDKNADKLYADFFIGKADDTWLGMKESPYDNPLKDSEMIVGFTHTHPGGMDYFSLKDRGAIRLVMSGDREWMNRGKYFTPDLADKSYFGLLYSTFDDKKMFNKMISISWSKTTRYTEIDRFGGLTDKFDYYKTLDFKYNNFRINFHKNTFLKQILPGR